MERTTGAGQHGETWFFDGSTWKLFLKTGLPDTQLNIMDSATYDSSRQRIVGFASAFAFELAAQSLTANRTDPRLGETITLQVKLPLEASRPFLLARLTEPWISSIGYRAPAPVTMALSPHGGKHGAETLSRSTGLT